MRARIAYISSLGTTAILVAAALLMLAVVGALVAFRGWPGSANGAVIQRVPLGPGSAAAHTIAVRPRAVATKRVVRADSFTARAAAKARVSTAGLVKEPAPTVVPGIVMNPVAPATMHPVTPGSVADSPAPAAEAPVATPAKPPSASPAPAPVGDGTSPLPYVPLPDPIAQGSPSAPSSDQVISMVGELIATPPPPMAGSVVDGLR
jgi:hypothetical protein